jgi:hypothetical protein
MNKETEEEPKQSDNSDDAWEVIRSTRWMQISIVLFTVVGSIAAVFLVR